MTIPTRQELRDLIRNQKAEQEPKVREYAEVLAQKIYDEHILLRAIEDGGIVRFKIGNETMLSYGTIAHQVAKEVVRIFLDLGYNATSTSKRWTPEAGQLAMSEITIEVHW